MSAIDWAMHGVGYGASRSHAHHPHHGVALELADVPLFTTQGTEDERHTVRVLGKDGAVKAETTDCPAVHGEAAAAPGASTDTVMAGCENGPVTYRGGTFHKVAVADAYARSGNLAGSERSPIVLGDYKVDEDAEQERPTRVAPLRHPGRVAPAGGLGLVLLVPFAGPRAGG